MRARAALGVALLALLAALATAAAPLQVARSAGLRPTLTLSVHRGGPATHVHVTGKNCPHPFAQPDELTWHDSYQLANRFAQPQYRLVRGLHRAGDTVTATFVVQGADHKGKGLLDLFCGGPGNAIAYFVVV